MNEIIMTGERPEFVREIVKKRGVIKGCYWSWREPVLGLITYASPTFLKVLFLTGVNAATSYYTIKIEEVVAGLWDIILTNDMEHFYKVERGEPEEDIDLEAAVRRILKGDDSNGDDEG